MKILKLFIFSSNHIDYSHGSCYNWRENRRILSVCQKASLGSPAKARRKTGERMSGNTQQRSEPAAVEDTGKKGYTGIYNRVIKRVLEFPLALAASVIVTPVILLIGIFIVLEDGFPILYTPQRGGYHGKPFRIFKLRTMRKDADRYGGTTALNDPRITRCGRLLRKIKFDELPQAYNVLRGDMSFVGPRPELLQYTDAYEGDECLILEVRPGVTDFSSIEFISLDEIVGAENADEMYEKYVLKRKNALRVKYAREVSFTTDVYLFFKTIGCVLKKAGRILKQRNEVA